MKKQIFAAVTALCLMATTTLFAQETTPKAASATPPTVEQMAQHQTDRMTERLKLTEAQAKKVYQVNLDRMQQMQRLREQMQQTRQATAEEMKSILTTEQFMQWAQMQRRPQGHPCQQGKAPRMKHRRHHQMTECPKACTPETCSANECAPASCPCPKRK